MMVCAGVLTASAQIVALDGTEIQSGLADAPEPSDTLGFVGKNPIPFDEIIVTASRIPQRASLSPFSVSILTSNKIASSNASTLAELLAPSAGVFVKDYGAASGVKTISQRGLGAEHSLILLNGMRITSFQNGQLDLGLIPVENIERIELIRGGHSAGYGADAVAGVVNIVTTKTVPSQTVRFSTTAGSFGHLKNRIETGFSFGDFQIQGGYLQERSDEDYPFVFINGNAVHNLTRQNSDMFVRSGKISTAFRFGETSELTTYAQFIASERGIGGPVVSPHSFSQARQFDQDLLVQIALKNMITPTTKFRMSGQVRSSYLRYIDPQLRIGGTILDSYFRNIDSRLETSVDFFVSDQSRIAMGGEYGVTRAEGNSLTAEVQRNQFGAFAATDFGIPLQGGVLASINISPGGRVDLFGSQSHWSPQIGFLFSFKEFGLGAVTDVRSVIRANVSRNFRMPTFNELYYNGGGGTGNSGLNPERSTSFELGGEVRANAIGQHTFRASFFSILMNDRIVWISTGSGVTPKNFRSVTSKGFEAGYEWVAPAEWLAINLNYSGVSSRKTSEDFSGDPGVGKQLVYVPVETFSLSVSSTHEIGKSFLHQIGVSVAANHTGYRYFTEDNLGFLPSHTTVSANARIAASISQLNFSTKFEVNNLFNKEYQVMLGYPMPLRSFRVTFQIFY